MSVTAVPQRVTIDVSGNGRDDLTEDEIVSLLDELADLRARAVRFVGLSSADEAFSLRLLHRAGNIGLEPVVELGPADIFVPGLTGWLDEVRPGAIAVSFDELDDMHALDSRNAASRIAELAAASGLRLEIDTLVDQRALHVLDDLASCVLESGATTWNIRVGRDRSRHSASLLRPAEITALFDWIASGGTACRTVILEELPHFRRYLAERVRAGTDPSVANRDCAGVLVLDSRMTIHITRGGEIFPSRMLRIPAGHVRRNVLRGAFFHHPTFERIREPERLQGRCGQCSFASICGGSRARAWLTTGDPLAPDPACDMSIHERPLRRADDQHLIRQVRTLIA